MGQRGNAVVPGSAEGLLVQVLFCVTEEVG